MATLTYPDLFTGETVPAKKIAIQINNTPLDFNDCDIYMQFRENSETGPLIKQVSLINKTGSGMEITNETIGEFKINSFKIHNPCIVHHDIKFHWKSTDLVRKLFKNTFRIRQAVTKTK